jgi:3-oxoacyl-[acyl-carrier protein] reductase
MPLTKFKLDGKCALITGASSGLGEHFAQVLARAGASVVLAARRMERLETLAARINESGGRAFSVRMDVTDENSIRRALDQVDADFVPPDILINNAGIAPTQPFLKTDYQIWRAVVDTNLIGAAMVGRHVASRMSAAGRPGSIVNVASILGIRAMPFVSAYAATKAAVTHLTRAMSMELARYHIRVNTLLPGFYDTDILDLNAHPGLEEKLAGQIPMGRIGQLQDLDGALLLLSSDASTYMTGSTVTVDGGHAINSW